MFADSLRYKHTLQLVVTQPGCLGLINEADYVTLHIGYILTFYTSVFVSLSSACTSTLLDNP